MNLTIIDDNSTNLALLEEISKIAFPSENIKLFSNPIEALEESLNTLPDLILIDFMMPGLDGIEFVKKFRTKQNTKEIPIIMITASMETDVKQRALGVGVTDFLNKPLDVNELKARLSNLAELRKSHLKLKNLNQWLSDEVLKATETILKREEELIFRLSKAAEYRDPETGGHIQRMAHYSRLIAIKLGLDDLKVESIFKAAPMHDIGKMGIPDSILLKPGVLDEFEFSIMKTHAMIGYNILQGSNSSLLQVGAEIAISHHEKWNGTGYPNHLKQNAIPKTGRIVAVADVFDALTSERPYKKAWDIDRAKNHLIELKGIHFDPDCVDAFLSSWDEVLEIKSKFRDDSQDIYSI
jgi:putative two-component system response regulator